MTTDSPKPITLREALDALPMPEPDVRSAVAYGVPIVDRADHTTAWSFNLVQQAKRDGARVALERAVALADKRAESGALVADSSTALALFSDELRALLKELS